MENKYLTKILKILKVIGMFFLILFVILWIVGIIYGNIENRKREEERQKTERIYRSEYIGQIEKKYPKAYENPERIREIILKSIKRSERKAENSDRKTYMTTYYDEKGRVVYTAREYMGQYESNWRSSKGSGKRYVLFTPTEKGYVYDEKGRVINKIYVKGNVNYEVTELKEEKKRMFLKDGSSIGVSATNIEYLEDGRRKETAEYINTASYAQGYIREETIYRNDKKEEINIIIDSERSNSIIIVYIGKKYDKSGKLIYKTVERKNKDDGYRSYTTMDLIKGEILTKYYDGDKAFATVTETLIGKDRAIVKRERVGDEVKIFDNYNKITEKSYNYIRNIIKNKSIYKVLKVNKNYDTFIFEYNDVKNGIDKNSFFYETFNLVAKEENGVTGQFGGEELEIYFNKNNRIIKKIFKDFYKKSYSNDESPIKDWENIIFYSNEKELEKYFLKNEEKEISTSDYEKINTMEDFRNGY